MRTKQHRGFAWIELLFALAIIAFLFQLFPLLRRALVGAADVQNWSRAVWVSLNVGMMLVLLGIRFGPSRYDDWRGRRARQAIERERQEKQRLANKQRELFERLREARKRQVM